MKSFIITELSGNRKGRHICDIYAWEKPVKDSQAMAPPNDMASDALKLGFHVSYQEAQAFLRQYPLDVIQQ